MKNNKYIYRYTSLLLCLFGLLLTGCELEDGEIGSAGQDGIDGIDGMASIVGIVIASSYAFIFYKLNMLFYLAISISIMSMLFGFLRWDIFSWICRIIWCSSDSYSRVMPITMNIG